MNSRTVSDQPVATDASQPGSHPALRTPPEEPDVVLENVGVRYRAPSERIRSIKEYTIRWLQRKIQHRDFWALQDVNLEVYPGEAFGIIGPNGAGKSTLLKLVARVLRPTIGRVIVRGYVAPLLEIGAT